MGYLDYLFEWIRDPRRLRQRNDAIPMRPYHDSEEREGLLPTAIESDHISRRNGSVERAATNTRSSEASELFDMHAPSSVLPRGAVDPVYEAKARVLNAAIQEIGMGRYQWQLFAVVGFGWASDNLWPIVTSLIFTPIAYEFSPSNPPLFALSQNIGLLIGAIFWGFGCDIFGRRWAFNLTIGITSVFGLMAAGSSSFVAICAIAALWSIGVGGNLPVDSAIFLEFLPASEQYLLTVLSIFWSVAQVLATLVAWPLLGYHSCTQPEGCTRAENLGWRWFMVAMGGMSMAMFIVRFFVFELFESPKFLMGKGRDEEAVAVVLEVARRNGKVSSLTIGDLRRYDSEGSVDTGTKAALKRNAESLSLEHVRPLFATPNIAYSTTLIILVWAFLGLGFPLYNTFLPYIQASRGIDFGDGSTYITYRNSLIIAVLGIPGALVGGVCVELPRLGRKGTLSIATAVTGVFLLGSTTASTSGSLLVWNCAYNFAANVMYAVLYSYTPEIFPTKDRGTGNALTATANRIFGIMAPVIAIYANLKTAIPVYISGGLFVAAGMLVTLLPFESRGRASL
jgi:MFS family permease